MTAESNESYAARCVAELQAYAEKSTRFGAGALQVASASALCRQLRLTGYYALEVRWESKDHHGTHVGGDGDLVTTNEGTYEREKETQVAEESRRRPTTAAEVAERLLAGPYPGMAERTRWRAHPRALYYQYQCGPCSGRGKVTCTVCGGQGQTTCGACSGSGRTNCHSCGGSGSRTEHRMEYSNGEQRSVTRNVPCFSCSGGRVNCGYCSGSGRSTCGRCSGRGTVRCETCGGHGSLTRVAHVYTYVVPQFSLINQGEPPHVGDALVRYGLPHLANVAQVWAEQIAPEPGGVAVLGRYGAAVWFCELQLTVRGRNTWCLLFGSPPFLSDAGGLLDALLESDIEPLRAARLPWSSSRAIKNFMESERHRDIVESEANGHDAAGTSQHLRNVVSTEYVGRARDALQLAMRGKLRWREFGWIVTIALLCIAATPVMLGLHTKTFSYSRYLLEVPARDAKDLWVYSVPVALVFGYLASKLTDFWIRRLGGKILQSWVIRKQLAQGFRTGFLGFVAGSLGIVVFFTNAPLWVDRDGWAYGLVPVMEGQPPLSAIAPVQPTPTTLRPPRAVPTRTAPRESRTTPARPAKKKAAPPTAASGSKP